MSNLVESIKKNEGFRGMVYKDHLGFDTVGYGFKVSSLTKDELALNGGKVEPMEREVAEQILARKLSKLRMQVAASFPFITDAPDEIFSVVMEMSYQMGVDGVGKFKKFLAALKAGDYLTASAEMLDSRWAKQTPKRAAKLAGVVSEALAGLA